MSAAHTAAAKVLRSGGRSAGVTCVDMLTTAERRPSRVAAMNCVYPRMLPVWPYTTPHGVVYLNTPGPAALAPGPRGDDDPGTNATDATVGT